MAFSTAAGRALALTAAALAMSATWAQSEITLRQAGSRQGPDFAPAYENREVTVRGTISLHAIPVLDYAHIAIQDEQHYGLLIKSSLGSLNHL
jgi:hypothetical protein